MLTATRERGARAQCRDRTGRRGCVGEHGLFRPAMDRHTAYLLADANLDDMVLRFRQVAGVKSPPGQQRGWEKMFPAHAAQFLIGAGNTLRWAENADLRRG